MAFRLGGNIFHQDLYYGATIFLDIYGFIEIKIVLFSVTNIVYLIFGRGCSIISQTYVLQLIMYAIILRHYNKCI